MRCLNFVLNAVLLRLRRISVEIYENLTSATKRTVWNGYCLPTSIDHSASSPILLRNFSLKEKLMFQLSYKITFEPRHDKTCLCHMRTKCRSVCTSGLTVFLIRSLYTLIPSYNDHLYDGNLDFQQNFFGNRSFLIKICYNGIRTI